MVTSLILTHLPKSLKYHECLSHLKILSEEPTLDILTEAFINSGINKALVVKQINSSFEISEKSMFSMNKKNIFYVGYWSHLYPQRLKKLKHAPWGLFFKGTLPADISTLSIVGSRKPNNYGIQLIQNFVNKIQTRPLQHISGLAYGTDTLAHQQTLRNNIPNFAVMGCGLEQIYPIENERLVEDIIEAGGGILSEYIPSAQAIPYHFPWRNRIIASLSNLVWLPIANITSGARHTINDANSLGITVGATPGDIFSELSELPNHCILEGANIILKPDDLDVLLSMSTISSSSLYQLCLLPKQLPLPM